MRREVMPFMHSASQHMSTAMRMPATRNGTLHREGTLQKIIDAHHYLSTNRRRLLVANGTSDWKAQLDTIPLTDALGAVQEYSSLVGGAGVVNPLLPNWLDGPYQWPPIDRTLLGTCPTGVSIVKIITRAFGALGDHIMNPKPVPVFAHQRMNASFPSIHRYNGTTTDFTSTTS